MTDDTICAVATAPGRAGVGIVRISGPKALVLAQHILGFTPKPRHAHYCDFKLPNGDTADSGIALYFPNPHSFTGEDVLELQGHGGSVVLDILIETCTHYGARIAKPGEFSERAFLNDKIDLAQAEAIADLIDATSKQAAQHAINTLKGEFSNQIDSLLKQLIHLRLHVESAIDFPEEEIDFLSDGKIAAQLEQVTETTEQLLNQAQQGAILREGMKIVIAGRPNAGKSSLLNRLAQQDLAIVTPVAGTTRDVLRQQIHIDGMPLHIIDTAGLHHSTDEVEKIGIQRAWQEIDEADRILLMIDSTDPDQIDAYNHWPEFFQEPKYLQKLSVIFNKIDLSQLSLTNNQNSNTKSTNTYQLAISAHTSEGIEQLRQHLKKVMGYRGATEGGFIARRRHIDAIKRTQTYLIAGAEQLAGFTAGELLAEDLRLAQNCLGEITGAFSPDDLLGKIFSSFCIGK
ncbi:MAG: tRNA uridine-5-carboxymethylaminomethyl(34) synthesis GTPase MnmE [Alteromonadaceae bacterium]|nr:MAG: tRNA uridine-5-carboxymethylaminomethyl(34) synthesis GTPase MnmE [Alteromonadaceae bacterium]